MNRLDSNKIIFLAYVSDSRMSQIFHFSQIWIFSWLIYFSPNIMLDIIEDVNWTYERRWLEHWSRNRTVVIIYIIISITLNLRNRIHFNNLIITYHKLPQIGLHVPTWILNLFSSKNQFYSLKFSCSTDGAHACCILFIAYFTMFHICCWNEKIKKRIARIRRNSNTIHYQTLIRLIDFGNNLYKLNVI